MTEGDSFQCGVTPSYVPSAVHSIRWRTTRATGLALLLALTGCAHLFKHAPVATSPQCTSPPIVADVVALEQPIVLNRFGAFMPSGMFYALQNDVVRMEDDKPINDILAGAPNRDEAWAMLAGRVKLRDSKRPRPLVLRVNEGQCLDVRLHNLMTPNVRADRGKGVTNIASYKRGRPDRDLNIQGPEHMIEADGVLFPTKDGRDGRALVTLPRESWEGPATRAVSFSVTGLSPAPLRESDCPVASELHPWVCGADAFVGLNEGMVNPATEAGLRNKLKRQGSLIEPGQSALYRYFAGEREGTFFVTSFGALVGGEGNGGQLAQGLFAAVNVQPKGAKWFRSQVENRDLELARKGGVPANGHPWQSLDYENARYASNFAIASLRNRPILAMLDGNEIVHSDLNAVIVVAEAVADGNDTVNGRPCTDYHVSTSCGQSYREFTVIMHDEVETVQAFRELDDPGNPLHYIKDNMGINYGVGGMGAMVVARNRGTGPAKNCLECRAEEFFLSSWANGDPAMVLKWDAAGKKPIGAKYLDDPSNVHHSYLNDPVRFRNIHAGPKETHVFHLHAHQWVFDASAPGSTYLDSQTIAPGATFSYEIAFGGSGNRNLSPGDSIFHCHLYPHFAQGMWELWRTHDVFEEGSRSANFGGRSKAVNRRAPDAEIADGTEIPAIVPIPGIALAPMPSDEFPGYPFYVAGEAGHRPPQPPLDFDKEANGNHIDGGLPRHVLTDGNGANKNTTKPAFNQITRLVNQDVVDEALRKGGTIAQINAAKVYRRNPNALTALAERWVELGAVKVLDYAGAPSERVAMQFHEGKLTAPGFTPAAPAQSGNPAWNKAKAGYKTDWASTIGGQPLRAGAATFFVNGRAPKPGAPFADPCPATYEETGTRSDPNTTDAVARVPLRRYKAAFVQTELTVNRHGWFDPQARILSLEQDVKDIINPNTRVVQPEPLFFRANSGDCIEFKSSNFVPNALALDDFQIYTPTDTIGQHIHLVKFDVTSSDGSGNGWNYEDGTYSPDEVRERVFAHNRWAKRIGKPKSEYWYMKTHPLFDKNNATESCQVKGGDAGEKARCTELMAKGTCPPRAEQETWTWDVKQEEELAAKAPLCGAQRTIQRWWADPVLDTSRVAATGKTPALGEVKDFTLRTVFTHDHFGPSSHQQHGLYAALVVEPANSVWLNLEASDIDWGKICGTESEQSEARKAVLGGANLSARFDEGCRAFANASTSIGSKELRPPMLLRNDGGPTSPRATIVAPTCVDDLKSNPLADAPAGTNANGYSACLTNIKDNPALHADQTRREFGVAFADFAILYNTALEPVNPENRDLSALFLGTRQVPLAIPTPLAISSEDPGTQLINYRNEPIPLRVADRKKTPSMGGFDYSQSRTCGRDDAGCTSDMANVFSSPAHRDRDRRLASTDYGSVVAPFTTQLLAGKREGIFNHGEFAAQPVSKTLTNALSDIERWRREFHCFVYPDNPAAESGNPRQGFENFCRPSATRNLLNLEPWRQMGDPAPAILAAFEGDPVQIRLIQGAQEAQHVFTMNGAYWRRQPNVLDSGFVASQPLGISEHFEFDIRVSPQTTDRVDRLYFGSSMDQLWDGMWSVMRSFDTRVAASLDKQNKFGVRFKPLASVAGAPGLALRSVALPPEEEAQAKRLAVCGKTADEQNNGLPSRGTRAPTVYVNAVGVEQLFKTCPNNGITFNRRITMHDPKAIVFLKTEVPTTLATLQASACDANRPPLEPMVLREAAGECIHLQLTNHLGNDYRDGSESVSTFGYNLMSMIVDGFNYNQLNASSSVGISATMLAQDPIYADGSNVGINGEQVGKNFRIEQGSLVKPARRTPSPIGSPGAASEIAFAQDAYWYAGEYKLDSKGLRVDAPIEFGAIPLRSFGDVIKHPAHSLVGALVVGPEKSRKCKPEEQQALLRRGILLAEEIAADANTEMSASMCDGNGEFLYRDFVLVLQDAVDAKRSGQAVPNLEGAEEPDDYGVKAINYKSEPLWSRRGGDPSISFEERRADDYAHVFSSKRDASGRLCQSGVPPRAGNNPCDPETPIFVARAGTEVRFRIVHPGGHTRQQAIAIAGHRWASAPHTNDSKAMFKTSAEAIDKAWTVEGNAHAVGPMMAANLLTRAGGTGSLPGDYLIRSQSSFLLDGGVWGLLRVLPSNAATRVAGQ